MQTYHNDMLLSSSFAINVFPANFQCDVINNAIERYKKLIFIKTECTPTRKLVLNNNLVSQTLTNLTVQIETNVCDTYPSENMDEEYSLHVNSPKWTNQALISSKTVWGVLRGLETFSQLISYKDGVFSVKSVLIDDFPRFTHRGIMVDTSRHFISKEILKQNLEAMSYNKLNVFHWHITDDQSFPFKSEVYPLLSNGAFNSDSIYKRSDVSEIIEFARLRGIRVIVEFDTPSHMKSWAKGYPNILTKCPKSEPSNYGPINVAQNSSYEFLENFFKEIASLFPESYVHLGGDEVNPDCWMNNEEVMKFKSDGGFANMERLEEYYYKRLAEIVSKLKKKMIWWEDPIGTDKDGLKLNSSAIIQIWKPMSSLSEWKSNAARIVKLGYRSLISAPWYLSNNVNPTNTDFDHYYGVEPQRINVSSDLQKLIIGGEACVWTEDLSENILLKNIWPLASTVAERLWSSQLIQNWSDNKARFEEHRCLMIKRGIQNAVINGMDSNCVCK